MVGPVMDATKPPTIFVSYSHDDALHLADVRKALGSLKLDGQIDPWVDTRIPAGADWRAEIDKALAEAEMAILLLSQAFLASEFIREVELPALLAAWKGRDFPIFVVVVSSYDDGSVPQLKEIQFVNKPERPLDLLPVGEQKQVWVALEQSIRNTRDQALRTRTSTGKASGVFLVPHRRNPYFSGREEDLEALHRTLSQSGRAAIIQVVKGLGGIGKTQLALEYAYRNADDFRHVLWVQADEAATLDRDYGALAAELKLSIGGGSVVEVRKAVMDWLSQNGDYLLVLDNADTPSVVEPYMPVRPLGRILITSRADNLRSLGVTTPQDLAVWTPEQGAEFLLRRVREGREAEVAETDAPMAATLSKKLGGLPLALEQAAAYMVETGTTIPAYSAAFDRQGHVLLEKHGPEFGPERTVATTWSLNIAKIEETSPASLDLLRVASFLAPDKIPFEIFEEGANFLPESLSAKLTSDPDHLAVGELLASLRRYSLVRVDSGDRTFDIHRLVQSVVSAQLAKDRTNVFQTAALASTNKTFPSVEFSSWPRCARLVPHALRVSECAEDDLVAARLLNQTGRYWSERGDFWAPKQLFERALEIYENVLGPEHPYTAVSLNNLAGLLEHQGDLTSARPLYERALAICEKVLGPEDPTTAQSLSNLAGLLRAQGDLANAQPLYERALAIDEKILGPEHPDTARILNNLAGLLENQGDLSNARSLFERTLAIHEEVLGPHHPLTALSLNNLAKLLKSQGDLTSARPLYEKALAVCEKVLGPEHPHTAISLNNLASLLLAQNDLANAQPLFERALAIYEKVLGPEHPDTALSLNNLAMLFHAQGDVVAARLLMERALHGFLTALPSYHPYVTTVRRNLAGLYRKLNMTSEAEKLGQEADAGEAEFKRRNAP